MICQTHPLGTLDTYKYVVVLSEYRGMWLLSRHRDRVTWETQGGHIEPGETPLDAARRELYEESGAADFEIRHFCNGILKLCGKFAVRAEDSASLYAIFKKFTGNGH